MSEKLEILKKKILYRASYRGTKEMDLLLSTFVKKNINLFTESQLKELENFLEFEDETILVRKGKGDKPRRISVSTSLMSELGKFI